MEVMLIHLHVSCLCISEIVKKMAILNKLEIYTEVAVLLSFKIIGYFYVLYTSMDKTIVN